jgi:heavy metal translocating P-type ATPase
MSQAAAIECCDYCGLPLAKPWFARRKELQLLGATRSTEVPHYERAPQYCCYGCRFAADMARDASSHAANPALMRLGLAIFLSMNVLMFSMVLWTSDVYADPGEPAPWAASLESTFRYLCLLLSLSVAWMLGLPLAASAGQSLRRGAPGTDLLLVAGVAASFVYSAVSVLRGAGHIYFEVGCVILVLVTLGRWLEATGRQKTSSALDALSQLLPATVCRTAGDGQPHTVPLAELREGDCVRVLAGERIPCDGRIVAGQASLDEQLWTGESQPISKGPGDTVLGGTLNLDGLLTIEVTAAANAGTLQRLMDVVSQARSAKGGYQRLADRIAAWFLPGVALVAIGAFAYQAQAAGFEHGLLTGLAVLVIACPCALGLATPMAIWTALGAAAKAQVLFRSGEALERLANVRTVCFDKTGTLTTGMPALAEMHVAADDNRGEALALAAALSSASRHAFSQAIGEIETCSAQRYELSNVKTWPGRGVSARVFESSPFVVRNVSSAEAAPESGGACAELKFHTTNDARTTNQHVAYLGSFRWMQELNIACEPQLLAAIDGLQSSGMPLCCFARDGRVQAVFAFREELRGGACEAIQACHALGLRTIVLTGDHAARARRLAEELQVSVVAELLPEDKVNHIREARTHGGVAMVGDGINDAPALAAADVGIALGCGADVSRDSAEVCLLANDLARVPWSIELARRTLRVVRQNLFWAFVYNVAGIALAASGRLNPIWAAAAMTLSGLLVITNSLRLAAEAPVRSKALECLERCEETKPSNCGPLGRNVEPSRVAPLAPLSGVAP